MNLFEKTDFNCGLSSSNAFERLLADVTGFVDKEKSKLRQRRRQIIIDWVKSMTGHHVIGAVVCVTFCLLHLLIICIAGADAVLEEIINYQENRRPFFRRLQNWICFVVLLVIFVMNIWLSILSYRFKTTELVRKAEYLKQKMSKFGGSLSVWQVQEAYPPALSPHSEAINLQWTIRDGRVVNIPWILLVRGDVILLRAGKEVPCRCQLSHVVQQDLTLRPAKLKAQFDPYQLYLPSLLPDFKGFEADCNGFIRRFVVVTCEVLETPALGHFQSCFACGPRPPSVIENESFVMLHTFFERYVLPVGTVLVLLISLVRYLSFPGGSGSFFQMFFVAPALGLIPLLGLVLKPFIYLVNLGFTAHLVTSFHFGSKRSSASGGVGGESSLTSGEIPNSSASSPVKEEAGEIAEGYVSNGDHHKQGKVTKPRLGVGVGKRHSTRLPDDSWSSSSVSVVDAVEPNSETLRSGTAGVAFSMHSTRAPVSITRRRHWNYFRKFFFRLLAGDPKYLPFSGSLLQTLGNLTSLSVVDKKGVLSWANPVPEKLLIMAPPETSGYTQRFIHDEIDEEKKQFGGNQKSMDETILQKYRNIEHNLRENDESEERDKTDTGGNGGITEGGNGSPPVQIPRLQKKISMMGDGMAGLGMPTVLDLTIDDAESFEIEFDDRNWRRFLPQLKPLGLNALLNYCCNNTKYSDFVDFLAVVSESVPRTLSVVNRRCLCPLSQAIGFDSPKAVSSYERLGTLSVFRPTPGDLPVPGLTKHRTPLANIFSVLVSDRVTGHTQLLSQGTAELVSEASGYYWDGSSLVRMSRIARKRIMDFYQRCSMTAYCLALSYNPVQCRVEPHVLDGEQAAGYVEWVEDDRFRPTKSSHSRGGTRSKFGCYGAVPPNVVGSRWTSGAGHAVLSHDLLSMSCDSLLDGPLLSSGGNDTSCDINTERDEVNSSANTEDRFDIGETATSSMSFSVSTASDCLANLFTDQIFLGMISMQYQAKPDVVQLVHLLDKACIRFVHFSKENELRSRVFAEKMGLEAGWNCHISLSSEGSMGNVATAGGTNLELSRTGSEMDLRNLGDSVNHQSERQLSPRSDSDPGLKFGKVRSAHRNPSGSIVNPSSGRYLSRNLPRNLIHNGQSNSRRLSLPRSMKYDLPVVHFRTSPMSPLAPFVTLKEESGGLLSPKRPSDINGPTVSFRRNYSEFPLRGGVETEEESVDSVYDSEDRSDVDQIAMDTCAEFSPIGSPVVDILVREKAPLLSDTTSRTSVMTSHSSVTQPMIPDSIYIGKEAKLPKGIENVRPHIENVDNVPLLVPLFTDCTPQTCQEMLRIMQHYGEVVCVLGSSLNFRNGPVYAQANCAISMEPSWPVVCLKQTADMAPMQHRYGPVAMANLLASLPSSLTISAGHKISVLQLVSEARHRLAVTRAALLFLFSGYISLSLGHLLAHLSNAPFQFPVGLMTWLSVGVLPLLSIALCCTPMSNRPVLEIATTKNTHPVKRKNVDLFAKSLVIKFLPSVLVVLLIYRLTLFGLCREAVNFEGSAQCNWDRWNPFSTVFSFDDSSAANGSLSVKNVDATSRFLGTNFSNVDDVILFRLIRFEGDWNGWQTRIWFPRLVAAQNIAAVFFVLYFVLISSGYVHYRKSAWHRSPLKNRVWLLISVMLILLQVLFAVADVSLANVKGSNINALVIGNSSVIDNYRPHEYLAVRASAIPFYVWIVGFVWPILLLSVNELYKRKEIRLYKRDQRRRKLSFNTKLGMNSPF